MSNIEVSNEVNIRTRPDGDSVLFDVIRNGSYLIGGFYHYESARLIARLFTQDINQNETLN